MINIEQSKSTNILEVIVIENATETDIEKFKPVLMAHIEETDDPRLLIIFENLDEWAEVVALWSDLDLSTDEVAKLTRIALVGEASWKGWLTNMIEKMVQTDLKFFGEPDIIKARKWLKAT